MASKGKDDDRDDDNNKRYASKLPNRKYGYFRDDQITFLVTHSDDEVTEEQLEKFRAEITLSLKPLNGGIAEKTPEAISFPKFSDREIEQCKGLLLPDELERAKSAFSIIKCDLDHAPDDPTKLISIVEGLTEQLSQKSIGGLTIQGTSFNWIASAASNGSGTGGPGGRPSAYYGSRKNAPYCFDLITMLKDKKIDLYGEGEGVDVAILDTAPCAQDLVAAHKEWPDHPIIAKLLGPEGKLHLYPATYEELLHLGNTSLNDHDYKMTDHGLFTAGIIHSIVPKAEIHLVEVLNQYGVGDFTSFVHGLQKVYTEKIYKPDGKLVINCSWMLDFPLDDLHCRHMGQIGDLDAEFEKAVRDFSIKDPTTLRIMLEFLFNRFYGLGRQAIAAAGNDGRTGDIERAQARYPAALRRVAGVGALPKTLVKGSNDKYQGSVFSNLSEAPVKPEVVDRGVVTLGGEEGEGKGVLGLYIGEFPDWCRNESKWAWWAGTSFAAPILTGAVASILSRVANNVTTTQDAIRKLYDVKIIKDGKANKQEDAMPVTQS